MFYDVGQQHRHDQDEDDMTENVEEGRQERDFVVFFDERKANGNKNCRDEIRQERVGAHLFEASAEFLRDDGCGCGTGRNDADEQGFHEYERVADGSIGEDERHRDEDEGDLRHACPDVPFHGTHPMEIDLAKRHEKNHEHKNRQNPVEHGAGPSCDGVEYRHVGEKQIAERTCQHGDGKRPVFEDIF